MSPGIDPPQGAIVPTLTIIGPGRLGSTLGRVFHDAGLATIQEVVASTVASAETATTFIGAGKTVQQIADLRRADLYLLAVPDDRIADCCALLADTGVMDGAIVFHCSGAVSSSILAAARDAGAAVASIHPVRSFADPAQVAAHFASTTCGAEGDKAALGVLQPLFEAAGARLAMIDPTQKTLYHAAAVFASNYVVTLIDVALQTYGRAGVAPELALSMIGPLLHESAANACRLGPAAALTGPIARGDTLTVERQQLALSTWRPEYAALYAEFARATAALAARCNADRANDQNDTAP